MYEQFKTRFLLFLSEIMLFVSDCDVPQNKVVYELEDSFYISEINYLPQADSR